MNVTAPVTSCNSMLHLQCMSSCHQHCCCKAKKHSNSLDGCQHGRPAVLEEPGLHTCRQNARHSPSPCQMIGPSTATHRPHWPSNYTCVAPTSVHFSQKQAPMSLLPIYTAGANPNFHSLPINLLMLMGARLGEPGSHPTFHAGCRSTLVSRTCMLGTH
jgi:hypothetical protein